MGAMLFAWIKGKLFSQASAVLTPFILLIGVFLVFNGDLIMTKFGYETRSNLKSQVTSLKAQVEQFEKDKAALLKKVVELNKAATIVGSTMSTVCEDRKDTEQFIDSLVQKRDRVANAAPPVKPKPGKVTPVKHSPVDSDQNSLANITMIHDAYDKFFAGVN